MRITKSFVAKDLNEDQKIIIYGAGRYGELALRGLQALNLQPIFFADRQGGGQIDGIDILEPEKLREHTKDIILVASFNYFQEILEYLQSIEAEYIYDILELIKLDYDESVLSEYALDEKHNWKKYFNVIENSESNKFIINHCELVLTECCSLKCRDCANLMQYYKKPQKMDCDEIIKQFNRFLDSIDVLLELRLLGGEPFTYTDICKIIDNYVKHPKIKRITIYTNSTILPNSETILSMKNSKVSVHMSDYGTASVLVEQLDELLTENDINHYIHKYDKWYDLGGNEKRNFSIVCLKTTFQACMMAKCYTFYRGKLYFCPRSAHGEQLGFFKNTKSEYVDYSENIDIEEKRKELQEIMEQVQFLTACDYCNGSTVDSKQVNAAIQL